MNIIAFSDWRSQKISLLMDFLQNLEKKPDLIIYAGDDISRFNKVSDFQFPEVIKQSLFKVSQENDVTNGFTAIASDLISNPLRKIDEATTKARLDLLLSKLPKSAKIITQTMTLTDVELKTLLDSKTESIESIRRRLVKQIENTLEKREDFIKRILIYYEKLGYSGADLKKIEVELIRVFDIDWSQMKLPKKRTFSKAISYNIKTYKGKCKLICRSCGRENYILNPTFDECLKFLFYGSSKSGTYRFFYNLEFDISAILKLWTRINKIVELKNGNSVKFKDYELFWRKGKFFELSKGRKKVIFTDIINDFHKNLDNAVKTCLHIDYKDKIDEKLLNNSLKSWANLSAIIDAGLKDVRLMQINLI